MAISLTKGGNVNLNKEAPGLKMILVGLSWDMRVTDGASFDLDSSVFMLASNDKVRSDADFIFYNQSKSTCGSVTHLGDNTTGVGEGDDEVVRIELAKLPANINKLVFSVTIHEAETRRQNFGMVRNASIRVVNEDNKVEVTRYDLSEDYSTETAMVFGELYRHGADWKFRAVGQGYNGGLGPMASSFGVEV